METTVAEIFWSNGQRKRVVEFYNGQRSGRDAIYNSQGVLVDEAFFHKSFPCHTHRRFDDKGNLIEEVVYHDLGRFSFRLYGESQNLISEGKWIDSFHYIERSLDVGKDIWTEKQGFWDGGKIVFAPEETVGLDCVTHLQEIIFTADASWEENFQLFFTKYPQFMFSIPVEKKQGMKFQFCLDFCLGKSETILVYGLGLAGPYFQLQSFLAKSPRHKLVFLEDDVEAFCDFLNAPHAREVLLHKQVFVEFFQDVGPVAEKYIVNSCEFVSISSKNQSFFHSLRKQLFQKMTLSFAIMQDHLHGDLLLENFLRNLPMIGKSFYVNLLKGAFSCLPVFICGAGPSLNENIALLKQVADRALIIAAGSAIAALSAQHVPFHFAVAIDPNLEEYRRLRNNIAVNTCLITSLRVHPDVYQTCSGPFGYMRAGIGGILEVWVEEQLHLQEPFIGKNLSPETMSVTGLCVALAEYLGSKEVFLCGVDLAYVNGLRYAENVVVDNCIDVASLDIEKNTSARIVQEKNRQGDLVYTATRWIMERNSLSYFALHHSNVQFFNVDSLGLKIDHVHDITKEECLEKLGKEKRNIQSIVDKAIANATFPFDIEKKIQLLQKQLSDSLSEVVFCLKVLNDLEKGSKALAEISLQEELAFSLFFYDVDRYFTNSFLFDPEKKWLYFLEMAQRFLKVFTTTGCR